MARIVVLDGYTLNPGDNPWDDLARVGDLEVHDRSTLGEIEERARGADIVVTNKAPLSAEMIGVLAELRFIAVTATGFNVVDVGAAAARRIPVSNVPSYGTESVAQFTLALVLELASRVGEHDRAVQEGAWNASPDFCFWSTSPVELSGLTMGVVGFGAIGRRVGGLAHAFGMPVLASGRPGGGREEPGYEPFEWCDVDELFSRADVVSLHCPLTADNAGLVSRGRLARMKPGAFLINTARGPLVDEHALADALERGVLRGAAVDVASSEPIASDNPLLSAPRCIVTPHIAWATLAARRRLMKTTVDNVRAFLAGAPVNVVR
ncbi:MAG: D-2-hydroxyacid dehydrogenase [Candidatus Binatia bacterium]|nr:D-2-hydroxyacid dehydrogenase [Candidatus Binatia bacterium]